MSSRRRQARESTVPSSAAPVRSTATTGLPDYEEPEHPLTNTAQRQLANLIQAQKMRDFEQQLQDAKTVVINSAGDLNERLTAKRVRLTKRKEAMAGQENVSPEDAAQLEEAEAAVESYRTDVQSTTKTLDSSLRKLIDYEHYTQNMKDVLESIGADARLNASTQISMNPRSQRQSQRDGEDEEMVDADLQDFTPTDPTSGTQLPQAPIASFRQRCETAKTKYTSRALAERYIDNQDHSSLRSIVHEATYPNEEVPMPDGRTWFAAGPPPPPGVTSRVGEGDEDEDDEDIAMISARTSTKCPVTLRDFEEPLTSKHCKHSYEAYAVRDLIQAARPEPGRGKVTKCPVGGCDMTISLADLYEDRVLIRRINRIKNAKDMADPEEEDGHRAGTQGAAIELNHDEDEFGEDVDALWQRTQARRAKPEPTPSIS